MSVCVNEALILKAHAGSLEFYFDTLGRGPTAGAPRTCPVICQSDCLEQEFETSLRDETEEKRGRRSPEIHLLGLENVFHTEVVDFYRFSDR